jgi:hypothetical protein
MNMEYRIDELIKAGWSVVDSDFAPEAFKHWRLEAFECLTAMFGPDSIYTKYFEQFVNNRATGRMPRQRKACFSQPKKSG